MDGSDPNSQPSGSLLLQQCCEDRATPAGSVGLSASSSVNNSRAGSDGAAPSLRHSPGEPPRLPALAHPAVVSLGDLQPQDPKVGLSSANSLLATSPQVAKRPHRPNALPPPHPNAAALLRASSPLSSPPLPGRASQSLESATTPATSTPNASASNTHAKWRPSPNSTPGGSVLNTPMTQCFSFPDELGDPSLACDPVDMRSASEFNPRSKLILELASLKAGADDAIKAILATWNNNSSAFRNNPLAPQPCAFQGTAFGVILSR
ncbi:hypothetical protein BCR44DRAFT_1229044 [Catenaria anguillulae PL171]|uniref:Uncharacterized protein n=1 Tax=Catenaria anguillulae PL171 TaxID=765915 RepID=A0A1Y2HE09_9FUNG|nr:hypothetical protein BCR44DRAFT_1229044 [Catenaria anguillulae PL171]